MELEAPERLEQPDKVVQMVHREILVQLVRLAVQEVTEQPAKQEALDQLDWQVATVGMETPVQLDRLVQVGALALQVF